MNMTWSQNVFFKFLNRLKNSKLNLDMTIYVLRFSDCYILRQAKIALLENMQVQHVLEFFFHYLLYLPI